MNAQLYDFRSECEGCEFGATVRIWNGYHEWVRLPSTTDLVNTDEVVSVIKCSPQFVQTSMAYAMDSAPHACEVLVIWAKDQETFDLLVKIATGYTQLMEMDDGEEGSHGKPH